MEGHSRGLRPPNVDQARRLGPSGTRPRYPAVGDLPSTRGAEGFQLQARRKPGWQRFTEPGNAAQNDRKVGTLGLIT